MELSNLSVEELELELAKRKEAQKEEGLEKIQQIVKDNGLTVKEVTFFLKPKREVLVYVNPDNPEETASTKGRKAKWLQAYIDNGGDVKKLKTKTILK